MPFRTQKKKKTESTSEPRVWTIGHSNRPLEVFLNLLQVHGVTCVVDVRTIPRSRHNPQFNSESLPRSLKRAGIAYAHLPGLGGLRRASKTSPNTGWRNSSFRGFADYMQSPEFENALGQLLDLTRHSRPALMCAEAVPWRCHRSLIADALLARGIQAHHIMSPTSARPHTLTPFAKVRGTRVTYPPEKTAAPVGQLKKRRTSGKTAARKMISAAGMRISKKRSEARTGRSSGSS
jgi:uncharacterized protein (DUF488 family)